MSNKVNLILPAVFLIGFLGTLAAVSSLALKLPLLAAGLALGWLYFVYRAAFAEIFTLAAALFVAVAILALNFFFAPPWYALTLLLLALNYLLFWLSFPQALFALVATLILAEIFWAVLFLPVYFLTAAVVVFAGFYLLYMIGNLYFEERLTRKKIYFHLGMVLLVLAIGLLTSPWQPLR